MMLEVCAFSQYYEDEREMIITEIVTYVSNMLGGKDNQTKAEMSNGGSPNIETLY